MVLNIQKGGVRGEGLVAEVPGLGPLRRRLREVARKRQVGVVCADDCTWGEIISRTVKSPNLHKDARDMGAVHKDPVYNFAVHRVAVHKGNTRKA